MTRTHLACLILALAAGIALGYLASPLRPQPPPAQPVYQYQVITTRQLTALVRIDAAGNIEARMVPDPTNRGWFSLDDVRLP